ncbi:MAG TPA: molybdopterin-dependent oxidoreductase [Nitrospirota bacterium]|nr:molybdopterin-dependent oxidoreductase [Nitrospirota bacterium]
MQKMTVTVDGKKVEVPLGATILEAANAAGSRVPTLCHDNKLHPFGACRVCLVEVEGTPRKFTPSCTTPATDGMVVRTSTPSLIEARRMVLELLLIKHPLDCPVCDKAGECQLQDLVHEYGLGQSRFDAEKGYLPPDYESPIIERNISRCILCGKCVRICDEQNGVGEWAFTRRGTRARISTDFDRPLDCEFCGECTEICPVGALTTRQFKYKARSWNLEATTSVCNYCGCGCGISYETRDERIMRVGPARNNYLCTKGRFGWDAVHHTDRLTTPKMRVGGELVDCTWDEALSVIATNLKVIRDKAGAEKIGGLGSVRTTNEDNYVFQKFLRTVVGTNNVDMLARLKVPKGLNTTFFSGELSRMADHDVILVLDKNVGEINPLTGIEIVRAVNKKERKLILVNDEFNKFNKIANLVMPVSTDQALEELRGAFSSSAGSGAAKRAADILTFAKSVAIIVPAQLSDKAFAGIRELGGQLNNVTYYPLVRRSNFQGSLDMGVVPAYYPGYRTIDSESTAALAGLWNAILPEKTGMNAVEMINAIKTGKLASLYIMGDDPAGSDPSLKQTLQKLEFLVVQDIFMTETAKLAHVVLPAASSAEKAGTFTNLERRLQRLNKAEEPVGESRPDWEIIQNIAKRMGGSMNYGSVRDILSEIRNVVPQYRDLATGTCWPREKSPLAGTVADLALASDTIMKEEVITAERLLFSSGMTITRSKEIGSIQHIKIEV